MDTSVEQRVCLKFCVANDISCSESLRMLQKAFGDSALSKTRAYEWYKQFKNGRTAIDDLSRAGRPSTANTEENVAKAKEIVLKNRRTSLRELASELSIAYGTAQQILVDTLGMRRVAARLVPKDLNFVQKHHRKTVAADLISEARNDPTFMKRIITGDETWVYQYDMETSQQSSEWRLENEPKPKKPRQSRSKVKILLTVFFDFRGVVHFEYLPPGRTVNKEYYLSVLMRLRDAVRRKRPELWSNNSWILHDDNAPSHRARTVLDYLTKHQINTIEQPPYSPDLAPCDFFLFPKLKLPLRGKRFDTLEAIKENATKELKAIPSSAYNKCMDDWIKRWHMCVASDGCYFEGDKINLPEN
ncbi:Mariner Mos1 transposase [Anthophora quadrimaculata]